MTRMDDNNVIYSEFLVMRRHNIAGAVDTEDISAMPRACLICGGPTRYAHMEIDACRACSVFYRRISQRKKQLMCRSGTFKCDTRETGNFCCKSCRFDRFTKVLNESKKPRSGHRDALLHEAHPSTSSSSNNEIDHSSPGTATTSGRSVIAAVQRGHSLMNAIRRASELSIRPDISDDQGIEVDGMVVIPSTYKLMNQTMRILVSSMFEFASTAFEEFKTLKHDDQWQLIRNFFPYINVLEGEYRMKTLLPEKATMCLVSYTTYVDYDTISRFLPDTSSQRSRGEGDRFAKGFLDGDVRSMRAKMRRWDPTEEEFIAFVGLSFWSLEKVTVSDTVHRIADKYRKALFLELGQLYTHTMGLGDYASRLGEAVMFLASVQNAFLEMRSRLGVLKLLDVIGEEMLLAQLHELC
ncbi:hypothetical protein PENTCL1PPCAC_15761 [Pristionchus entomophagus]|uniref:Nuclear receptor n=1 Tax=Pristionchus entomophagus TaxID=358040 RepID=A0AAV5TDD5_9BILA|nr:hypothetical protein PENTCL1PPCAC_15761 [Pristionchus entomophagus]